MSAPSPALEPTPNLRFADPLSPLESALTEAQPVPPLESALTTSPGGWWWAAASADLHESVAALPLFRLSTFDYRLWQIVSLFLVFGPFSISFRINTCISVASKRLYPSLESTLMKKPGEGGGS